MAQLWLIWSNQHGAWWKPNRRGYTQTLEFAGRYPLQDALEVVSKATLDGQLRHTVTSPDGTAAIVDEHMVPAPLPLARIQMLADAEQLVDFDYDDPNLAARLAAIGEHAMREARQAVQDVRAERAAELERTQELPDDITRETPSWGPS